MKRWLITVMTALGFLGMSLVLPQPAQAIYQLDYGDTISVQVKDFPQYSYTGPVRPDGQIAIPFVGEIDVEGLTTAQVTSRISLLLRHVLRDPIVTVTITTLRPRYVMVVGEVQHPGRVEINQPHMTVLDALGAAGGFTQFAVRNRVLLLHGQGAGAQRYEVDIDKMLKTADLTDNLELQPNDRISVQEGWRPTISDVIGVLTPIVTLVTTITLLVTVYNSVAGSTTKTN